MYLERICLLLKIENIELIYLKTFVKRQVDLVIESKVDIKSLRASNISSFSRSMKMGIKICEIRTVR